MKQRKQKRKNVTEKYTHDMYQIYVSRWFFASDSSIAFT